MEKSLWLMAISAVGIWSVRNGFFGTNKEYVNLWGGERILRDEYGFCEQVKIIDQNGDKLRSRIYFRPVRPSPESFKRPSGLNRS